MKTRQIINFTGLLFMLFIKILADTLPLNNLTGTQVSAAIPALFNPAGYVFVIWWFIYLSMLAFGVYQLLPAQKNNLRIQQMGYWFTLSCVLNSLWIVFWHYGQIAISLLVMLGLLFCLIKIYIRSEIGKIKPTKPERWLIDTPFSIYLGWISVSTVTNIAALDFINGWNGWGLSYEGWTILMILGISALAIWMMCLRHDIAFPMVIAWSLSGIYIARQEYPMIASTSAVMAIVIVIFLLMLLAGLLENRELPESGNKELYSD
ncbi:MAG: hypothetical protein JEZ00_11150 [Anaerolineaceae bacterium]|nr:hypothetical protein [Anaerolineaceae bacterium]